MRRSLLPILWALLLTLLAADATAQPPAPSALARPLNPVPAEASALVAAKVPAPLTLHASAGGKLLTALESPVARHLVVSALAPVPGALARDVRLRIVGSHGAAARIEKLDDASLARMTAPEMAALAVPVIRPNFMQRFMTPQRERLATAFFRVLDSAGRESPGKLDAVLANMRLTGKIIPRRDKLEAIGAKDGFEQRVNENRIRRGDLHAFDQRLGQMGMQKGEGSQQVLIDGKVAFADVHQTMMTALDAAKATGKPGFVLLSTFALESDQTGRDFGDDLKALSAAGFKVYADYDGVGSKMSEGTWSNPKFYDDLKAAGIDLHMVKASPLMMHNSHKKPIEIGYTTPEGEPKLVEYNGDMNIGDEYRFRWHGSMTRIEGPATKATLGALIEQLKANGAAISPAEEAGLRRFGDAQVARPGMSPIWTIDHHGPVDLYNKVAILSMIDVAPRGGHIYLEQPYVNDPDLFAALERAARDGVNVHIIVPRHNNQTIVATATRMNYKKLLDAGAHLYEFDNPKFREPTGFSHLKRIAVLDAEGNGIISEDGSSNGDAMSFYHNDELIHVLTTASIKDPALREAKSQSIKDIVKDVFEKDIQNSHTVTEADLPKPGFRTAVAKFLSEWDVLGWVE